MSVELGIPIVKQVVPFYGTAFNHSIGYQYNMIKNILLLPPSELSQYRELGITEQKADRLLRLECFAIQNQFDDNLNWFNKLDNVGKFVIIAVAKITSVSEVLAQKSMLTHMQQGRFTAAALELEKAKVNSKLVTILKTGKVR